MDNYKALSDIIEGKAKKHINAGTVWAKVKEVDWDSKTMTATGLTDGLDYFDVRLGAGYRYRRPKQDSLVLLSVIENQPSATALLFATEVEEEIIQSGDTVIRINEQGVLINGDNKGGLVVSQKIADEINELKNDLNSLKMAFNAWTTVPNDGGAALKASTASWAGQSLTQIQANSLENNKVKHGD